MVGGRNNERLEDVGALSRQKGCRTLPYFHQVYPQDDKLLLLYIQDKTASTRGHSNKPCGLHLLHARLKAQDHHVCSGDLCVGTLRFAARAEVSVVEDITITMYACAPAVQNPSVSQPETEHPQLLLILLY